jgi:hypothetical protein
MTSLQTRTPTNYRCYLVEVTEPNWNPDSWQTKPRRMKIIRRIADTPFRGRADAWKFLHNMAALANGTSRTWLMTMT